MIKNNTPTYKDIYKRSDKYEKYIRRSTTSTYNILEGSIRSSKSVANIMAFATNLLVSPDNLHMVCGTTAAVARAVWLENDGLGLLHFFKGISKEIRYEGHKAVQINLPDREIIILVIGLKNQGSYKGFRGMSIGMVGFTELDLLDKDSIIEAIGRTLASKHRRFFMDFNPTSEYHQIYRDDTMYSPDRLMRDMPNDTNYMHCTIKDNPIFTPERILEVTREYDPDSIPYKRFIEGKRVNAEGLIYTVREYNIIEPPTNEELNKYSRYVIIADPGQNASATTFILLALTKDRKHIDVLKEYWHRNFGLRGPAIKMPEDYVIDFIDFINKSIQYTGYKPYQIKADNDLTFQREFDRQKHKYGVGEHLMPIHDKDEINDRIKTGINYLYQGRLRFSTDCPKSIESFKIATYDEKKAINGKYERLDDPVKGTMIDCIDAVEYGWKVFEFELSK